MLTVEARFMRADGSGGVGRFRAYFPLRLMLLPMSVDPVRAAADALRDAQRADFVCGYPSCGCEHVCAVTGRDVGRPSYPSTCPACRGTGGGTYNDCPTCDGNGVV